MLTRSACRRWTCSLKRLEKKGLSSILRMAISNLDSSVFPSELYAVYQNQRHSVLIRLSKSVPFFKWVLDARVDEMSTKKHGRPQSI